MQSLKTSNAKSDLSSDRSEQKRPNSASKTHDISQQDEVHSYGTDQAYEKANIKSLELRLVGCMRTIKEL